MPDPHARPPHAAVRPGLERWPRQLEPHHRKALHGSDPGRRTRRLCVRRLRRHLPGAGRASNQIVELSPSGVEIGRFGAQLTGTNNSSVPFDSPSGVAFLGTEPIIANQSYFAGSKANQALLALETGEPGAPVFVPGARSPRFLDHSD